MSLWLRRTGDHTEKDDAPIFEEIVATARENGQVNIKHFMQKYNLSEDIIHEGLMERGMRTEA